MKNISTYGLLCAMLFCASTMISCGDDPQSTGCPEDPDVPQLYSIALTDDGNGTATVTVGGKEADEAEAGTTVTATASPAEGYLFDMWSAETGDVIFAAATAAATTFIMPAGDVAIEARFKTIPVAEKYTLTITAGDGGDAVATVDGREISEAEEGTTITLTATPDEGYLFVAWASETPNVTFADPTNASTTFEMPSSGVTVTAEFIIEVTEIDVLDNIADANFRSYCLDNFDGDGNGKISLAEAEEVTEIEIPNAGVASLEGIESFVNLETLDCSSNSLTSIDVSELLELKILNCSHNQLTELDVTNNTALTNLACSNNQIVSLTVSHLLALTELLCDNNKLTQINVWPIPGLISFSCHQNELGQVNAINMAMRADGSFDLFCGNQRASETWLELRSNQWTGWLLIARDPRNSGLEIALLEEEEGEDEG